MAGMSRPRRIDPALVSRAQAVVAHTRDIRELRAAQAVLLPAVARTTLEQTAKLLGVGRATVARLQASFRWREHEPTGAGKSRRWGGRRQALLTQAEEKGFLALWEDRAKAGELVVLSSLRTALAERVGHSIAPSVLYRLVARNGWRKVAPDTRHPKTDLVAQQEWKKKRFRKWWQPC
jgi:transposase